MAHTMAQQSGAQPDPLPPRPSAASIGAEASAPLPARKGGVKAGAPFGNRSAERHGVWSFLALGRLPKGGAYIRRLLGELRRELEARVAKAHGEVILQHAALVTTVCRHEGRALLLSRYLALEGDSLKLMDRMSILEAIGRATDARDKAIERLDLARDREAFDFKAFYAEPLPTIPAAASALAPPSDDYARPAMEVAPSENAPASAVGGPER